MIEVNLSGQWVLKSEAFEALTTTTSDGVVELGIFGETKSMESGTEQR